MSAGSCAFSLRITTRCLNSPEPRSSETHAHADHLTAAQYFKQHLGQDVPVCIGQRISQVQETFAPIYGLDDPALFEKTFDCYLKDDEQFELGRLSCRVMHLPGHTPDHVGYMIGKAVFTGDSIFNVSWKDVVFGFWR